MKVLDLQCSHAHSFEGWFASEADFQDQQARGLITCPLCGQADVHKKLSAPRLNLSTSRGEAESMAQAKASTPDINGATTAEPSQADAQQLQAAWMKLTRHVLANTEDVGAEFSQEARKMHYGDAEHRNIRGQATPQETQALLEEGIQVMPLPMADALKGTLQ